MDYRSSMQEIETGIERNAYGGGAKKENIRIQADGEFLDEVEIEVSEQRYEGTDLEEMFQRCISKIEKDMLGSNQNLNHVETDLHLMKSIADEPVDIAWELDDYQVMNIYGEIDTEQVVESGTTVNLKAIITYREDETKQQLCEYTVTIYPETLPEEKELVQKIENTIEERNFQSQENKKLLLPTNVDGKRIQYFRKMNDRGFILIIMAVLTGVLLYVQGIQNKGQELQKRKQQMLQDYPEILNQLTLFLGAGMTMKRAWKKVVTDYDAGKKNRGIRYAYEEMKTAMREMESGFSEVESYERFGKRCDCQEYVRFGALVSQNIRKGSKGLLDVLHLEAIQAFENRKARARMLGEEAGTKLLIPMFIMMMEVFVIVIVPAFLTMQI